MDVGIELTAVAFGYEGGGELLRDVELRLCPGELVAITGPVGGGKSTLLKLLAGLLEPTRGRVTIERRNVWALSEHERNDLRRRMGFDFQEAALIANMTIFDNLALPLRYHEECSERAVRERIEGWLDRLGLARYRQQLPATISLGLRRRASFVRAMLAGDEAFFWDDPTAQASDDFAELVRETIAEKRRAGAVQAVVTRDRALLQRCDRVAVIGADGRVTLPERTDRLPD